MELTKCDVCKVVIDQDDVEEHAAYHKHLDQRFAGAASMGGGGHPARIR